MFESSVFFIGMVEYNQFINALKGQFHTLNIILFLLLLTFILFKWNKRNQARLLAGFTFLLFLLFSTAYLPQYLVSRMESAFDPFDTSRYPHYHGMVYIHVLGAGYQEDRRLPADGKLSFMSLGRLAEGIRIGNLIDSSVLVVSGNIASGDVSMASVYKNAAAELGFDPGRIEVLETPGSTKDEAIAFVNTFGAESNLILVTDAVHMRRAMRFFRQQGIEPYPAPSNFVVKRDENPFALKWMPAAENLLLMDRVLREFFGSIKAAF